MNNTTLTATSQGNAYSGLFAWATIFGAIAVAVVSGNSLIITAFAINRKLLHTRTNYFLVSLALADLLVGSFSIPMYVYDIFAYLEKRRSSLHNIYYAIDIFTSFASIFALVLVAMERAFSVYFPHKHRLLKRKVYFILIGCTWIISSWLASLRFFSGHKKDNNLLTIFSYLMMTFIFISLTLITAAYTAIWHRVNAPNHSLHKSRTLHESRLAKTLIIVTCVFFFCWLPFYIISIVIFYCSSCYHLQVVYCSKLLHYSNSLANVLIYTLRIREFKLTILRIFCREPHISLPKIPAPRYELAFDGHAFHEINTANEIHLLHINDIESPSPKEQDSGKVAGTPPELYKPSGEQGVKKYWTYI